MPAFSAKVYRMEEAGEELEKFHWFRDHIGLKIIVPYFLPTALEDWDNSRLAHSQYEREVLFLRESKFEIT